MLELTSLSSLPHHCLVLTLDTLTILIDASTPDGRPPANLPSQIDFILLCHSTPNHINALARIALTHPHTQIYSTVPVANLGRLSTLETTPAGPTVVDEPNVKHEEDGDYAYLTHKDVDRVFDRITTLRYSQPTILSHGVTITAYPAGHTIGGTIWNIRKDQENIVVMLDWNHAKERIVGGMLDTKTARLLDRASSVITDVRGSAMKQSPTRKSREQYLIGILPFRRKAHKDSITSALTADQDVLIPAPPPTRTFDLLLLLDTAFHTTPTLQKYPVFYLARTANRAITATKTMLEWLSQEINLQDKPLEFKHIKIVTSYSELTSGASGARLLIVDGVDLEPDTLAHQAFLDFKSSGHLLLFPWKLVNDSTIAGTLLKQWDEASPILSQTTPRSIITVKSTVQIPHTTRIPLTGDDLLHWKRQEKLTRDQKTADAFYEQQSLSLLEDQPSEDEDEDEDLLPSPVGDHRLRGSAILLAEGTYDYWRLRTDPIRAGFRSFPFIEKRKTGDDYGWSIRPEDFLKLEDESKPVVEQVSGIGQKRKWVEEVMEEEGEGPAREVREVREVSVHLRIGYVDLEGLHDGRAVGNLLPRWNTRKLVSFGYIQQMF